MGVPNRDIGTGAAPNLGPAAQALDRRRPEDGAWRLIELIGEGGMGQVYSARQRSLGRVAAAKLPRTGQAAKHEQALIAEAVVTAALDHPGVVPIYDLGRDAEGHVFYTMRLIDGDAWSDTIGRDLERDVEILAAVAQTCAFAHSRGIIHRDIKPENVLLGSHGEILLCDWGIAAAFRDGGVAPRPTARPTGTPIYAAPEMADPSRHAQGPASDVYLLGATLWHALTGDGPHPGNDGPACMAAAARGEIIPAAWEHPGRTAPSSAIAELVAIARRAMAVEPAQRHASAEAFRDDLRHWQRSRAAREVLDRAVLVLDHADRYADFQRAEFGCIEAERLGLDAASVAPVRTRALQGLAALAITRGDLELAADALERLGNPADLRVRYEQARARRREEQLAAERLAEVEAAVRDDTRRAWRTIVDLDLTRCDRAMLDQHFEIRGRHQLGGDGLLLESGQPSMLVLRQRLPGDVRVVFSAVQQRTCDDVSCVISGSLAGLGDQEVRGETGGYQFRLGWRHNTLSTISAGVRVLHEQAGPVLVSGRPVVVSAQRTGGTLTWLVAGRDPVVVEDPEARESPQHARVWISSYLQPLRLRHVRIESLGVARRGDLLDLSEYHMAMGHLATAQHLMDDVLVSDLSESRRERFQELQQRMLLLQARGQAMEDSETGVRRAVEPAASVRVDLAKNQIAAVIGGARRIDLAAIAGLPIDSLSIRPALTLTSLSGIESAMIQHLWISHGRIESAAPLAQVPVRQLALRHQQLTSSAGIPQTVSELDLGGNPLTDLHPLAALPLQRLLIPGTRVRDLSPLRGAPLHRLDISRVRGLDPAQVVALPLRALIAEDLGLESLEPLSRLRLERLLAAGNAIEDLAPLARMLPGEVGRLDLSCNRIRDLGPLQHRWIMTLLLAGNPIGSWDALGEARINSLDVSGCPMVPLARILDLVTGSLRVTACGVSDVSAFAGRRLARVDLGGNAIRDPSPLAGCGIEHLNLSGNPIETLGRLIDDPPAQLRLWHSELDPMLLRRAGEAWRAAGRGDLADHAAAVEAILAADLARWRPRGLAGWERLPVALTGEEVLDVVARLGLRLVPWDHPGVQWQSIFGCWLADADGRPVAASALCDGEHPRVRPTAEPLVMAGA